MLLHHVYRPKVESASDQTSAADGALSSTENIVLLHGLFGSASNLGIIARGMAEHFNVYSLDLPNHGRSPRSENFDYSAMGAAVAEFIRANALGRCHLLGHSMGGKAAMQVAMDNPELVDKLVVADVAPVQYPPHHNHILAGLDAVAEHSPQQRREADAILARHVSEASVRAFLLKSWQPDDEGSFRWLINREAVKANYANLGMANVGPPWPGPTLFIKGSESDYILPQHRDQILALFPAAEVKIIQGTGHWLHAEKPAIFNRLVTRFLLDQG